MTLFPIRKHPILRLAILAFLALNVSVQAYDSLEEVRFSVFDENGTLVSKSLDEYRGKIVALYYFSPW